MKRCDACGVEFTGELETCPLCQAQLVGDPVPAAFPRNEVKRTRELALRILAFATGVAVLLALFVGNLVPLPGSVTFIVCLSLLVGYAFVRHILGNEPNFMRIAVRCYLGLMVVLAGSYLATGSPVVPTFVFPGLCLVGTVFDAVVMLVYREKLAGAYIKYLLLGALIGMLPLAFDAAGLTALGIPSYVSALAAGILLLALVTFWRESLCTELRKLFTI